MLEDIEAEKIGVVITKDLSRLGRDYLKTGYLSRHIFQIVMFAISQLMTVWILQIMTIMSLCRLRISLMSGMQKMEAEKLDLHIGQK